MQQYNVLQAIYKSFYSKQLYRDVAENWGGKTFLYLLLLLFLSWIIMTIQFQHVLNKGYNKYADQIASQVPLLTIKDGQLSTPENKPYLINSPDNQSKIAVIDTSGQYTSIDQAKAPVLVTQSAVMIQTDPNEIKTYEFSKTLSMNVDPQVAKGYIANFLGYLWIPFFILLLIGSYIYRIIQTLVYGVIGKIFSAISGSGVSYAQCVQLSMMAITPAIILATILDMFAITFHFQGVLYFLISLFYLFYGILANKKRA